MLGVKHLQRAVRRGDTRVEASPHPCPIPAPASRSLKALCNSLLTNREPLLSTRRYLLPVIPLRQPSPCSPQPDSAALLLPAEPLLGLGLHPHHLGAHQQPQEPSHPHLHPGWLHGERLELVGAELHHLPRGGRVVQATGGRPTERHPGPQGCEG